MLFFDFHLSLKCCHLRDWKIEITTNILAKSEHLPRVLLIFAVDSMSQFTEFPHHFFATKRYLTILSTFPFELTVPCQTFLWKHEWKSCYYTYSWAIFMVMGFISGYEHLFSLWWKMWRRGASTMRLHHFCNFFLPTLSQLLPVGGTLWRWGWVT